MALDAADARKANGRLDPVRGELVVARPTRRTGPDYVNEILARAAEPWVCLALDGAEILRLRLGSWAVLLGGSGAGKSSLVSAILTEHARLHGPAVYISLEMGGDEVAARVIGMSVGASWEDVLRGKVTRADMLAALPPRLRIFDREVEDVAIDHLDRIVEELRAAHPAEPILAAVDYVQLAAGDGPDVRTKVAGIAEKLRTSAKRLRIATIGVSQTSRASGRALRAGELVGAETMTAGAESSGIERAAYATIAIGASGPPRDDGRSPVELHLGKGRFGGGDRVLPMLYDGRTGLWRVAGASRAAADLAAERAVKSNTQKAQGAKDAILAAAGRAPAPRTREELRQAAGVGRNIAKATMDALVESGALVECEKVGRSHVPRLWTPDRRAARQAEQTAADARRTGEA
jgi:hypothetical protein